MPCRHWQSVGQQLRAGWRQCVDMLEIRYNTQCCWCTCSTGLSNLQCYADDKVRATVSELKTLSKERQLGEVKVNQLHADTG